MPAGCKEEFHRDVNRNGEDIMGIIDHTSNDNTLPTIKGTNCASMLVNMCKGTKFIKVRDPTYT